MTNIEKFDLKHPVRQTLQKYLVLTDIREIRTKIENLFVEKINDKNLAHERFRGFMSIINNAYFSSSVYATHLNQTSLEVMIDYSNLINNINASHIGNYVLIKQTAYKSRKDFFEKTAKYPNEIIELPETTLTPRRKTLENFASLVSADEILIENAAPIDYLFWNEFKRLYCATNNQLSKLENRVDNVTAKISDKYYEERKTLPKMALSESYNDETSEKVNAPKVEYLNHIKSIKTNLMSNLNTLSSNAEKSTTKK